MPTLTRQEENIYNTYLYVSRKIKNKPVTLRKDFSDMDDKDIISLKRISTLFLKYPHIEIKQYFEAPFKVYTTEEYFDLQFYASMAAVKAYTIYMKQIQEMDPDSEEQLQFIAKSIRYILEFCTKSGINADNYIQHKTGVTYDWMKHLKQHMISIYSLMEYPNLLDAMVSVPKDEQELFLGETLDNLTSYQNRYYKSNTAKLLVKTGIEKINTYLKNKNTVIELESKVDTE